MFRASPQSTCAVNDPPRPREHKTFFPLFSQLLSSAALEGRNMLRQTSRCREMFLFLRSRGAVSFVQAESVLFLLISDRNRKTFDYMVASTTALIVREKHTENKSHEKNGLSQGRVEKRFYTARVHDSKKAGDGGKRRGAYWGPENYTETINHTSRYCNAETKDKARRS